MNRLQVSADAEFYFKQIKNHKKKENNVQFQVLFWKYSSEVILR